MGRPRLKPSNVLTVGQAARFCKCAPRTVTKWVDSGQLPGFRLPMSQDRRILRKDLVDFLNRRGIRAADLNENLEPQILVVALDSAVAEGLRKQLPSAVGFHHAANGFDAGYLASSCKADAIVMDCAAGIDAVQLCRAVRRNPALRDTMIFALSGDGDARTIASLVDEFFERPVDTALVAARVWSWIEAKKS